MSAYLLDTNVVSTLDPRKGRHVSDLLDWMQRYGDDLCLSVVTAMEMRIGILMAERKGASRRAADLDQLLETILESFGNRVLPIEPPVALLAAEMTEQTRALNIEAADLLIAATAEVHGLTVLTRNLRHFTPTGVKALDPLAGLPDA